MLAVVTGAAGFIGSTLTDRLLSQGASVRGVDCFREYYPRALKERNLASARRSPNFVLTELDLALGELEPIIAGADVVFHLAAQAGVRPSWDAFPSYVADNMIGTQRLLTSCINTGQPRVVIASSSSVYGDAASYPTEETASTRPRSPYGVTKLASEALALAFGQEYDFTVVALRYFTVFGPRQRPDMAIGRLIRACLGKTEFVLYGDGTQVRDFTYVDDVVDATIRAGAVSLDGCHVMNIAGGSSVSMEALVSEVEAAVGNDMITTRRPRAKGDVARTGGSTRLAGEVLGWRPQVSLADGIRAQVDWERARQ